MKDIEKILLTLQLIPNVSAFDQSVFLGARRYLATQIPNDLNAIRELELLVIEKVGEYSYGESLFWQVSTDDNLDYRVRNVWIATADAPTRIAAMLAALEGE